MSEAKDRNRLAGEKSPYLLQHVENPVDWYPWGDEAFARAREQDSPVFLSIGYSTCHWCHVMAHESFEDPLIAGLMNETFVSIKVDREERPDIDMLYMTVCQMMTGSGGWPLTIIMTPDRQPFFAGTYIPRESRFGNIGLLELIPRVREIWTTQKDRVLTSAGEVVAALQKTAPPAPGEGPDEATLHLAYRQLSEAFDEEYGGFGVAPKFPTAHNFLFLLGYWKRTGGRRALEIAEKTLDAMRRGGIYDHIGFGFHRYSTDRLWLVPHFEKMLYDQALLALAYLETFQATGKDEYARTAREIFTYVLRDMTAPEGTFYSAEDADSEGEEGKFYLWKAKELRQVLSPDQASLFISVFGIEEGGNFNSEATRSRSEKNIPHLAERLEDTASGLKLPLHELQKRLEEGRLKLFAYREKRIHPHKDDKVLADWNGLMIAALARGALVLDEPGYAEAAGRAVDFIFSNMVTSEGRLLHRYRDREAMIPAHLDDYAFMVYGLLELYEATFITDYLIRALRLNGYMIEHFVDAEKGGFYFTADDAEGLLIRQKEAYDGALPSGNSVAMLNLLRLARITAAPDLEQKAAATGRAFSDILRERPSACTQLMIAADFAVGPSYEVVIAGALGASDTRAMLQALRCEFTPNMVVVFLPSGPASSEIRDLVPFARDMTAIDGRATAYVCVDFKCRLPVTDAAAMLSTLKSG